MKTNEERVAEKLASHLNDFQLDLEAVGRYIGLQPFILYSRFMEVLDSALYQKEEQERFENEPLSDNIEERFEQYRQQSEGK